MRTATLIGVLLALALLDGACSGFRSSAGRTGLIQHRRQDATAAARGMLLLAALVAPVAALAAVDVWADPEQRAAYLRAGQVMLAGYLPYAVVALVAFGSYWLLGWRHRFLAAAIILGPFTLVRPVVVLAAAGVAAWAAHAAIAAFLAVLCAIAVLAVQPLADRLWYGPAATADLP